MIRIGDFARIVGVSVATLRLYDEEGLLSPAFVHPESGYRYYESPQIRDLNQILVFKDLGFSLPEIARFIREPFTPAEIRRLLSEKRMEAEARLSLELDKIKRIERRIQLIEKENRMPQLEVVKKTVPAMTMAAIRLNIPTNDQVPKMLGTAYQELWGYLSKHRITPKGPSLALWYTLPSDHENEVVDAAFPVDVAAIDHETIRLEPIPETLVASVVHTGPFSEFQQCHVALSEWLAAHNYRLEGAYREIYHDHLSNPATTEVQYPIVPATMDA